MGLNVPLTFPVKGLPPRCFLNRCECPYNIFPDIGR